MGRIEWRAALAALLLITVYGNVGAATVLLFDGNTGPVPGQLLFASGGGGSQSFGTDGVTLDSTSDNDVQAGYTNWAELPPFPPFILPSIDLDRSAGVTVDFEVRINQEDHGTDNDRSGFVAIVVTNDRQGVELSFWKDAGAGMGEIWAQEIGFNHSTTESVPYDTSTSSTTYSLHILGLGYSLLANGAPLLSGSLRDLSGVVMDVPDVYDIPNFLFFGDNTTSAQANVTLGDIALTTPVPLPPSIALMLAACIGLVVQGRRFRA